MRYRVYSDGSIGTDDVREAIALSVRFGEGERLDYEEMGELTCATLTEQGDKIAAERQARRNEMEAFARGLVAGRRIHGAGESDPSPGLGRQEPAKNEPVEPVEPPRSPDVAPGPPDVPREPLGAVDAPASEPEPTIVVRDAFEPEREPLVVPRLASGATVDEALRNLQDAAIHRAVEQDLVNGSPKPVVFEPPVARSVLPDPMGVGKSRRASKEFLPPTPSGAGASPRCIECKRRWCPPVGINAASQPCPACERQKPPPGLVRVGKRNVGQGDFQQMTSRVRICEGCYRAGERRLGKSIQGARPACERCGQPTAEGIVVQVEVRRGA